MNKLVNFIRNRIKVNKMYVYPAEKPHAVAYLPNMSEEQKKLLGIYFYIKELGGGSYEFINK